MAWLTRGADVLASAEVARTRRERRTGLMGREGLDGVLVLSARSVHTFGVRFPIDVAFCDADGVVMKVASMGPNRISAPVWRARTIIEAPAGTFHEWNLSVGDRLEIR